MDFGDNGIVTPNGEPDVTPNGGNGNEQEPVSINGDGTQYDANGNPITPIDEGKEPPQEPQEPQEPEVTIEEGTQYQVGEDVYTVDKNGNLVDNEGNIFKEAKDVKEWLDSFEQENPANENEISIDALRQAFDIDITDENGNSVEFENTVQGVKAYVDQVIEASREDNYNAAIQTLFNNYPFVEDMINYYRANGGSLEGYGQIPDRSNIEINESDEAQQEYIIRTAWKEQGRKGSVDGYIAYLKSTGNLYATAQEELTALQENDREYREHLKQEAQKAEEQRVQQAREYWKGVHDIIESRQIAGHVIPESITVTRDGKTTIATLNDFYKYLYEVDGEGKSRYMHDLEKEDPKAALEDQILKAYLKFTGGSYSNLVDMAISKKEVNKLILKAKNNKKPSISVRKPAPKVNKVTDLGYK